MEPYGYDKLGTNEIRIIQLLPGAFEDELQIEICKHTLDVSIDSAIPSRPPLESIQQSLTDGWQVFETRSGRHVFHHEETGDLSYEHPVQDAALCLGQRSPQRTASKPNYEALSYVWGDTSQSIPAHVIGGSYIRTLQIGQNLHETLRHLRLRAEKRSIWVDALSIDQTNMQERGQQVQKMADIYRFASRVVVWLGSEAKHSSQALSNLGYLGLQFDSTTTSRLFRPPDATESEWWNPRFRIPFDQQTWNAIGYLLQREWFERLWVVQEVQMASPSSVIQCGFDTLPWGLFCRAIICLRNKIGACFPGHDDMAGRFFPLVYPVAKPMEMLLRQTAAKLCADPRDHIYGILGMAPEFFSSGTQTSYTIPVEAVYRSAFMIVAGESSRLDLLALCSSAMRNIPGPSWVPDWSSRLDMRARFSLSSGMTRSYWNTLADDILEVTGVHCGFIEQVSDELPGLEDPQSFFNLVHRFACSIDQDHTGTPTDTTDNVIALLTEGAGDCRTSQIGRPVSLERCRQAYLYMTWRSDKLDWGVSAHKSEIALMTSVGEGSRIALTSKGHLSLVPAHAVPGDLVACVLGCSRILILRDNGGQRFNVIGPAYVHGLADGESLLGKLPPSWTLRFEYDSSGYETPVFHDSRTGESHVDDPRLPCLAQGWRRVKYIRTNSDPLYFDRFENEQTGQIINWDPRQSAECLEARGIALKTFHML